MLASAVRDAAARGAVAQCAALPYRVALVAVQHHELPGLCAVPTTATHHLERPVPAQH